MKPLLTLLFLLINFGLYAQQGSPIKFVNTGKQSSVSIRPEVTLFSHFHEYGLEAGEFSIHPKPGISIGYSKRYRFYKSLGFELGVFGGITRFSFTATAPKENFSSRTHTFALTESLVNPFLSVPLLMNFQHPLNNLYLLTLYGGANFKAHFLEQTSTGLSFSNAPGVFPEGEVFEVNLFFKNKQLNTGIIFGAGIGRMLPNHNILQLNLWANLGLKNQVEGTYLFYDQVYNSNGEKVLNSLAGAGPVVSKGTSFGTELRYSFTGIKKKMKAVQ